MTVSIREFYNVTYRGQKFQADARRKTDESYHWQLVIFENFFREFLRERGGTERPPTFDDLPPDEFATDLVERAMQWQVRQGNSATTANTLRSHLNALWNYGFKKGLIGVQPRNSAYRTNLEVPVAFMPEEFDEVLRVADHWDGRVGTQPANIWWGAIIRLGHCTMVRRQALVELPTGNLDLVRGTITVMGATQKHRQGQVLDLLKTTIDLLRELKLHERRVPTVLGDFPWGVRTLNRHFAKIVGRALGLERVPPCLKWHALRRTGASEIIAEHGLEYARIRLGHSTVETTKRYYDPRYDLHRRPISQLMKDRPRHAHGLRAFVG
jgi:integrase